LASDEEHGQKQKACEANERSFLSLGSIRL
jgi:hypothetical protein